MKLIAQKPCSFGGKKFYIGDVIPTEYVLDPKAQEAMGVLSIVPDNGNGGEGCETIIIPDPLFSILVQTETGERMVEPTDDGIQDIFNVLIGTAENAGAVIAGMDDVDSLILLSLADSRKTVKDAAKARIKALCAEEESEAGEA